MMLSLPWAADAARAPWSHIVPPDEAVAAARSIGQYSRSRTAESRIPECLGHCRGYPGLRLWQRQSGWSHMRRALECCIDSFLGGSLRVADV